MQATQPSNVQPAFRGASFSSTGSCVHHPDVKLSQKLTVNGRVVYQELRRVCPKCEKDPPISKMNSITSLNRSACSGVSNGTGVTGGSASTGKSRRSEGSGPRRSESRGKPSPSSSGRSSTPGRGRSSHERRPSNQTTESRARSSSRSRAGSRPRGRSDEEESRGTTGSKSKDGRRASSRGPRKEYETPFDSKGRCHYHVHVQLAKKKMMGGWNVLLDTCPKCMEDRYIDDARSDTSGRSNRTAKSSRSLRSTKSTGTSSRRIFSRSSNQYESPFDCNGYCNRHKYVRLAKKKTLGGWKIIEDFCIECVKEDKDGDNASTRSGGSRHSRRSSHSKSSRVSKSSRRSGRSRYEEDETESAHSTSQSEQVRKKIVKKMRYKDSDSGEEGLYTGYVNGEYQPHGRGKLVYPNGDRYDGTWCEGTKVHGKTSTSKTSSSKSGRDDAKSRDDVKSRDDNPASHGKERSSSSRRIKRTDSSSRDGSASTTRKANTSPKTPLKQSLKQQMDEYRDLYQETFPIILEDKAPAKTPKNIEDKLHAQTVKNMRFVDFYGDPGRYSGEVNEKKMPHGMGEMTYDHGLVQGGKWTNGVLDEGTVYSGRSKKTTDSGSSRTLRTSSRGRVREP